MIDRKWLALMQVSVLMIAGGAAWEVSNRIGDTIEEGGITVVDSNDKTHTFPKSPERVVLTNTYAATVMRMLGISNSVVVGVSGDFNDDLMWPELSKKDRVQQSAHSEIDFESLLDTMPEVYIVFATNGMVDTNAIRDKLEPVGVSVVALDFYKYDSLEREIGVLADIFDKRSEAGELFAEFAALESLVSDRLTTLNDADRPSVVIEHHASLMRDPVVLTGTSQWTDLVHLAGGNNVFSELPGHTTHVDMEAILDENPDVLMFDGIVFDIGFNSFDDEGRCETHFGYIEDRTGFENMDAVANRRMAIMSGEFAGPMMIHGLPTLAKIMHPSLFEDVDAESILDDYFSKYHNVERIGKFVCTP
tara:strand:- start:532 stop:1617 length:1086 start_codon:yes stop_codon:yes gene_type:complete